MNIFDKLSSVNVNEFTEKKKNLTYLSWAHAWGEFKKLCPDAVYKVRQFNGTPYLNDSALGIMVMTEVTASGETHEMWLPVMDGANNAMRTERYSYKVKEYSNGRPTGKLVEKFVEPATMFDINKTIMRCLTKNLAMFGLGLYIYAGEDLPADSDTESDAQSQQPTKQTPTDKKTEQAQEGPRTPEEAIAIVNAATDLDSLKKAFVGLPKRLQSHPDVIAAKDQAKYDFTNNE